MGRQIAPWSEEEISSYLCHSAIVHYRWLSPWLKALALSCWQAQNIDQKWLVAQGRMELTCSHSFLTFSLHAPFSSWNPPTVFISHPHINFFCFLFLLLHQFLHQPVSPSPTPGGLTSLGNSCPSIRLVLYFCLTLHKSSLFFFFFFVLPLFLYM